MTQAEAGRFAGRVLFAAGAGTSPEGLGIGAATAVLFAREGAAVFAVDSDAARSAVTRDAILLRDGICSAFTADLSDEGAVRDAVRACLEAHGRIDVLFNNVGIQRVGGPEEVPEAEWDRVMAANAKAMYLACRHVLPVMASQGRGVIVNTSSFVAGRYVIPGVAYAASKGAVEAMTRNIAVQYASRGIRAVWVAPGIMRTPRLEQRLRAELDDAVEQEFARRTGMVPLGCMGDAEDVAQAVAFLASDAARYITATGLLIDGGLSAAAPSATWAAPAEP